MHIYAFTPTYEDHLRPETVASMVAQKWAGRLTWEIGRHNPYPAPDVRNVGAQYERARARFLAGDYDALWLVEHDMTFGPDTLAKLAMTMQERNAVIYAPYMLRHGTNVLSAWRYDGDRNLGMSLSLHPADLKRAKAEGISRVSGVGFGCTLIAREVVERIAFRLEDQAPDTPFAKDCLRAGVVAVARWDAACGHIHEGVVLSIEKGGGMIARVLALQTVNVMDDGQSKALIKDHYYSIGVDAARELARAGYVRITNDVPAEEEAAAPREEARQMAVDPVKAKRKKA